MQWEQIAVYQNKKDIGDRNCCMTVFTFWDPVVILCTTRFHTQKFYFVLAEFTCVCVCFFLYDSEKETRLFPSATLLDKFLITEMEWAYCAVFTDYLYII